MKLRHRFALTFAVASLGTLLAARVVTLESFHRVQEYELDQGLRERAREESSEVALHGRKALEQEYAEKEETDPLEQLVTYGALYRADGTVVADTPSFAHAPALDHIGISRSRTGSCFDFRFRSKPLRGVLVQVSYEDSPEPHYLLLAASRGDMDADARKLLAVGWWVVVACLPLTLAIGWWLGRRMTKGIEELATAAARVTAGELDLPIASKSRDEEVAALGAALREMVDRLKALIETERRFASHAAHELRSPLTALRGELELALRRERSPSEYEATLRDALDDTNRLVDLAEDLLVVARLDSGAVEGQDEETDVADLVDEAVAQSAAHAPARIVVDRGSERVAVRGAHVALVRMIRNLVDNAVVHGGPGEVRVRVRGRVEDGARWAEIEVEDEGEGVPEEDRDRIFERFHRGARARLEPGAGLGLGIAREVARRHGGDVVMASPAKPTRFVIRLRATEP